jgi:hypothetical protein
VGELAGSIGQAITNLFAGMFRAIEGALQGVFGAVSGALPMPILFVVTFVGLGAAAWFLAKR